MRALAGAILLGSSAGALLGGVYLLAAPNRAPAAADLASANAQPPAQQRGVRLVSDTTAELRDRIRLAPPPVTAASPFRDALVARAATDLDCLTQAVYFEARGEAKTGQEAVAQVVLNRVRHPAFPKSICAVVHQRTAAGCQFSFVCSSQGPVRDAVAWRRAQSVARDALHGSVMAAVGDATNFQTARSDPFAGLLKVAQIGAHVFYRFAGRAGSAAMFHQRPVPSAPPAPARIEVASLAPVAAAAFTPSRVEVVLQPGPAAAATSEKPAAAPARTAVVNSAPVIAATVVRADAPAVAKTFAPSTTKPAPTTVAMAS